MAGNARRKTAHKMEFGDWQTPISLARQICVLVARKIKPQLVFEPNCGKGAFLRACIDAFPDTTCFLGLEINLDYVHASQGINHATLKVIHGDFFDYKWTKHLEDFSGPVLVIGNPPWVTNSELMRLRSKNLPPKANINSANGIDAITGKSNFDISEWMLIKELEALQGRNALLAMLCKTSVARKALAYVWKNALKFSDAEIREIDAHRYFNVAVNACLLLIRFSPGSDELDRGCAVYPSLEDTTPKYALGMRNGRIVSNKEIIDRYAELIAVGQSNFIWRSGIKHDCANVMELRIQPDGRKINGYGQPVDIEDDLLYPMLKSSDLANGNIKFIGRVMLAPQRNIGGDTSFIKSLYPKTWRYLQDHAGRLGERGSSIYKNRPQFSIFGVGEYTFKPWKVAISGLYKTLKFSVTGPYHGKPVVFDDTCYFLACKSEDEATLIKKLLESNICHDILNACIFWDSKRPITKDILSVIDLIAVSRHLGIFANLARVCPHIAFAKQATLL